MSGEKAVTFLNSVANNPYTLRPYPAVNRGPEPQVFGILLTPFSKAALETQDSVRLSMLVTRVMETGFGTANYNKEKSKDAKVKVKKNPADFLYNIAGDGSLIVKSYVLDGMKNKGAPSEQAGVIIPGMVLQLSVFKDSYPVVFGGGPAVRDVEQAADMPMFSSVLAVLGSRSLVPAGKGGLVQLRQITLHERPLLFDTRLVKDGMGFASVAKSSSRLLEYMQSDALTETTGYPICQEYLQNVVSQTRHVLQLWVAKENGDIGRNADGTLYVQLQNSVGTLGVEVSRVRLHDPGNFITAGFGSGDWVENLLRFALEQGALCVTMVYDSARQGMQDEEQILDGFCTIAVQKLFAAATAAVEATANAETDETVGMSFLPSCTPEELECYIPEGDNECNFGVLRLGNASDQTAMVVSGKTCTPRTAAGTAAGGTGDEADGAAWTPVLCHPSKSAMWTEGHLVRVFKNFELVSYFVVPTNFAGCSTGGSMKRKFNALDEDDLVDLL